MKCFWALENDAEALWANYRVGIAGVLDIQLLATAYRAGRKDFPLSAFPGLDKAIQSDLNLGERELNAWRESKRKYKNRMRGNVFNRRPLKEDIIRYCMNDVFHLPELQALYMGGINHDWLPRIKEMSLDRVARAHSRVNMGAQAAHKHASISSMNWSQSGRYSVNGLSPFEDI